MKLKIKNDHRLIPSKKKLPAFIRINARDNFHPWFSKVENKTLHLKIETKTETLKSKILGTHKQGLTSGKRRQKKLKTHR